MNTADFELLEQYWQLKSRDDFYTYRQYINANKLKLGWFTADLAKHLQQFYNDYVNGLRPILIISAPPQHGKSFSITDFIQWLMGKQPGTRTIYASFSDRLGIRANRTVQRAFDNPKYQQIFPELEIGGHNVVTRHNKLLRNNEIVETEGGGYFRNTTVGGPINGEGLDLGIIDDAFKGRKEANSPTIRRTVWEWFTDDYFGRFSETAGMLMINTRWHVDDLAGRMIDKVPGVKVINYQALDKFDNPLFPEHKSKEFLIKRRSTMLPANWNAVYQGNPIVDGGNMIDSGWWIWGINRPNFRYRFITVDTAQKTNTWNDYTVFQAWGKCHNGKIHLIDQLRERMKSPDLRRNAKEFYDRHNNVLHQPLRAMYIEDKSSGTGLIQDLELGNYKVVAVQRSTDKVERANDTGPEIMSGKVVLYKDVKDVDIIVDEATTCPNGVNDDAFDACMTAIEEELIKGGIIDYSVLV